LAAGLRFFPGRHFFEVVIDARAGFSMLLAKAGLHENLRATPPEEIMGKIREALTLPEYRTHDNVVCHA
jgi:hypothetical protein